VPTLVAAPGPDRPGIQAIVIGDSTAAGVGNPAPTPATPEDTLCHRSSAAYAQVLAQINGWSVENLACSGATVAAGILGPQRIGKTDVPPQLAVGEHATKAQVVIVSIGANDVQWSTMMQFCAAYDCVDWATTAYFQQELATFSQSYYALLRRLADRPGRPQVLVNLYYDPFGQNDACLNAAGLTQTRKRLMIERLHALNGILRAGAEASSFLAVEPDFTGHEACSAAPYVQGLHDVAPFHPTVAGELAIALADDHALRAAAATAAAASSVPASPSAG
jgi:lysophospholipase L1-like esterase